MHVMLSKRELDSYIYLLPIPCLAELNEERLGLERVWLEQSKGVRERGKKVCVNYNDVVCVPICMCDSVQIH